MVKNQEEYNYRYSINVWQRYASPVWFDIRQTNTLNTKQAKEDKDGKHICPLQLDVIERCIALWTNPNDLVFSPFTGIGSEGYQAIKQGRKFVGSELKESYFNVAVNNLQDAVVEKRSLFDENKLIHYEVILNQLIGIVIGWLIVYALFPTLRPLTTVTSRKY